MRWLVCFGVILAGCGVVKTRPGMGWLKGIATLNAAEAEYHYDNGQFATSLQELGPNLIGRDLASGEKDGYRFTLTAIPAGYTISATPVSQDVNNKSYFSDQSMRIHVHTGPGTATANDPFQGEPPQQQSDPVAPRQDKTNS